MLMLPSRGGVAVGMALGIVLGLAGFAAIAIVHAIVAVALFALTWIIGRLLQVLDTSMLRIKHIRMTCPNCYEQVPYPGYQCPQCGRRHQDVRPGRYGTLWRRCLCGARLPNLLLLGSARMEAYCPYCHSPLEHQPGKAQEVVLPFSGAVGAGKTRLMYGIAALLCSSDGLVAEFADSITSNHLKGVEELLARGTTTSKTAPTMPHGLVLRVKSGGRTRLLQLFDVAGEHFYRSDTIQELRYLTTARTLVFVIDPLSIHQFWNELSAERQVELTAVRSSAPAPELAYQLTVQEMQAMGVRLRNARLAVVFSRADLLPAPGGESVDHWAQDTLGLANLVRSSRQEFREVRFFRTASILEDGGKMHQSIVELTQWLLAPDGIHLPDPNVSIHGVL